MTGLRIDIRELPASITPSGGFKSLELTFSPGQDKDDRLEAFFHPLSVRVYYFAEHVLDLTNEQKSAIAEQLKPEFEWLQQQLSVQIKDHPNYSEHLDGMQFALGLTSADFPDRVFPNKDDVATTFCDVTYLPSDTCFSAQAKHPEDPSFHLRHEEGHQLLYRLRNHPAAQGIRADYIYKMQENFEKDVNDMVTSDRHKEAISLYQRGEGAANAKSFHRFTEAFADLFAIATRPVNCVVPPEFKGHLDVPEKDILEDFSDIYKQMPELLEHPAPWSKDFHSYENIELNPDVVFAKFDYLGPINIAAFDELITIESSDQERSSGQKSDELEEGSSSVSSTHTASDDDTDTSSLNTFSIDLNGYHALVAGNHAYFIEGYSRASDQVVAVTDDESEYSHPGYVEDDEIFVFEGFPD